jgi:uncharacterized protein (DUF2062 family)
MGAWLIRKIRDPLVAELRQGATPDGLAASIATGATIAVLPLLGVTTFLCLLAGKVFRLNHIALQIANHLLYPLQFALLVPFIRLGEWIVGAEKMPVNPMTLLSEFSAAPGDFMAKFAMAGVHGALAWILTAPLCGWILWQILRPIFRRLSEFTNKP